MMPRDKQNHFIVGGVIGGAVTAFLFFPLGVAAVIVAGVGKEVYDYHHRENHTPELMDAVWTVVGGVLMSGLVEVMKVLDIFG